MIRVESRDAGEVLLLTLVRPERRNALTMRLWRDLAEAVRVGAENGARAIVITGAGSAFSAGADLDEAGSEMAEVIEAVFAVIRACPAPVIAHVNGPAVGAGAQLCVSCDLRVVDTGAVFAIPAAEIGLPVHPATIRRLAALAGIGGARAMLLGGERVGAARALALGLADRVGDLDVSLDWAGVIAGYAPLSLRYLKSELELKEQGDAARYAAVLAEMLSSDDRAEAIRARAERRRPVFTGR